MSRIEVKSTKYPYVFVGLDFNEFFALAYDGSEDIIKECCSRSGPKLCEDLKEWGLVEDEVSKKVLRNLMLDMDPENDISDPEDLGQLNSDLTLFLDLFAKK